MARGGYRPGAGRKKGSGLGLKYTKAATTKKNAKPPSRASMAMLQAFVASGAAQAGALATAVVADTEAAAEVAAHQQ